MQGSVGPWTEKKRKTTGPFWPDQAFRDLLVIAGMLVVLVALTVFARAPISGQADPLNTSYAPKPEWNFLFLYEALKVFKGSWEPLGTVGLPTLILLLFLSLPFIDRGAQRNPLKRPVTMLCGLIFVGGILTLTIMGSTSTLSALPTPKAVVTAAPAASAPASAPAPGTGPATPAEIAQGEALFTSIGCIGCHAANGQGGNIGPDVALETQKGHDTAWLLQQLVAPKSHNPNSAMPSFESVPPDQRQNLVA
jgi:mono/diheme cytochrome c family protein